MVRSNYPQGPTAAQVEGERFERHHIPQCSDFSDRDACRPAPLRSDFNERHSPSTGVS
jgi:hypothetical protein